MSTRELLIYYGISGKLEISKDREFLVKFSNENLFSLEELSDITEFEPYEDGEYLLGIVIKKVESDDWTGFEYKLESDTIKYCTDKYNELMFNLESTYPSIKSISPSIIIKIIENN